MRLRRATSRDASAVAVAYLDAWRAGYEGLLTEADLEAQAQQRSGYDWGAAIARPDRVVRVAQDGHEIVGVVECEHDPPVGQPPWLHMLYVIPSAWGTGVAAALLDQAIVAVRGAGQRTVWLEVVEAQARARRFYEREGWRLDDLTPPGTNGLFRLLYYRYDLHGRA